MNAVLKNWVLASKNVHLVERFVRLLTSMGVKGLTWRRVDNAIEVLKDGKWIGVVYLLRKDESDLVDMAKSWLKYSVKP